MYELLLYCLTNITKHKSIYYALIHATVSVIAGLSTIIYCNPLYYTYIKYILYNNNNEHIDISLLHNNKNEFIQQQQSVTTVAYISIILFLWSSLYYLIDYIELTILYINKQYNRNTYILYTLHHIITVIGLLNMIYQHIIYNTYDIIYILPVITIGETSNIPRSIAELIDIYNNCILKYNQITDDNNIIQIICNNNNLKQLHLTQQQSTILYNKYKYKNSKYLYNSELYYNIHLILFFINRFLIAQYTIYVYRHIYTSTITLYSGYSLLLFSLVAIALYILSTDGGYYATVYDKNKLLNNQRRIDIMV